ncbi:MAG: hypothetical protein ACOX87_12600 [Chloroflexota bacterium]|jgi:hypothetical protein
MKALLLDGTREEDSNLAPAKRMLLDELRAADHEVQDLVLRNLQIAPCMGCFKCWTRTPLLWLSAGSSPARLTSNGWEGWLWGRGV